MSHIIVRDQQMNSSQLMNTIIKQKRHFWGYVDIETEFDETIIC